LDLSVLVFLSAGLFLGWSLGANDAANVFGTAVGTRMVRFGLAATVCSIFVILGAVFSGAGAAHTLGRLGAVDTLAGAGMAAFSAALTVYWMIKLGLSVSTSQAIVGAIVGWNLFSDKPTDLEALLKIVATWVICPLAAAFFAVILFLVVGKLVDLARLHIFRLDAYTRLGLILAGALGSYSLGANNIANVMGVFVGSNPFTGFSFGDHVGFSAIQQLFLLGAIAIAVGVFTYSKRVMMTIGTRLFPLSPLAAWVAVVAHSIVLILFASEGLERILASNGLPTIPLVPVSSSQAVVGAVIGIGLWKGAHGIQWRVLGSIAIGWVTTPIAAGVVCFISLFFLQNVFNQEVFEEHRYSINTLVVEKLEDLGADSPGVRALVGRRFKNWTTLRETLQSTPGYDPSTEAVIHEVAKVEPVTITLGKLYRLDRSYYTPEQIAALWSLAGDHFFHRWRFEDTLAHDALAWRDPPDTPENQPAIRRLQEQREAAFRLFKDRLQD